MKHFTSSVFLAAFFLGACSETDSALFGGGASVNEPRQISASLYEITCERGGTTRCMAAATNVCGGPIQILEQTPRTGFVRGDPAHLIDASFKCN